VSNRENDEDPEFFAGMKSPTIVPGKPPLLRHLSGLLFSPVLEDGENTPTSASNHGSDTSDPEIQTKDQDINHGKTSAVRGLFRSPSVPCRVSRTQSGCLIGRRNSQKRAEVDQSLAVIETKRQKSCCDSIHRQIESPSCCSSSRLSVSQNSSGNLLPSGCRPAVRPKFHRSHSETEVMIKCALSRAELHPDLIGDFSKPYCLPLVCSAKHPDLKAISADTVRTLCSKRFNFETLNNITPESYGTLPAIYGIGITHCYLPPGIGWYSINLPQRDGRLS